MQVDRYQLPADPTARVDWTLERMGGLAIDGLMDPRVVMTARTAALEGRPRDRASEAAALLAWVRRKVRFIPDPVNVEVLATPGHTLAQRCGDCDEQACLLACMAMAVGFRVRLVAASPSLADLERRHVWPELMIGGRWVAADPTFLDKPLGWRVSPIFHGRALELVKAPTGAGGLFDSIKDSIGDVLEGARDLIRKPLRWTWDHMGPEMRSLVSMVGPVVAGVFLPGFGAPMSKAAIAILEGDRNAREAKAAMKKAQEEGQLPAWVDLDNREHLEAIVHAADMPPAERAAWERAHAPGGGVAASPERNRAALAAAAMLFAAKVAG